MAAVPGRRLRVYTGEAQRVGRSSLYHAIVMKAYEAGLAGVTVSRGIEGYGYHHVIHSATVLDLSTQLPVVVEVVDTQEKIDAFAPALQTLGAHLMTVEDVMMYLPDSTAASTP